MTKLTTLSIDASAKSAAAAVYEGLKPLSCIVIENGKTHSQELMKLIDKSLAFANKQKSDIGEIIIACGPGSFTGIRIAMSTAKALAHGLDAPLTCVPTLYGLSYHGRNFDGIVCPIMDARRDRVYAAAFDGFGGAELVEGSAIALEDLCEELKRLAQKKKKKLMFVGDGVLRYRTEIKKLMGDACVDSDDSVSLASAAGLIMAKKAYGFKGGRYDEAVPIYLRKPQAQRERDSRLMRIRPATLEDVPLISKIEEQCFPNPWQESAFVEEIEKNEMAFYFVAELSGETVGYIGYWWVLDEAHITNVAVSPSHRKNGIARALISALIKDALEKGIVECTLEVRVNNAGAIRLYSSLGFEGVGVRKGYYLDSKEDALIMSLDLGSIK